MAGGVGLLAKLVNLRLPGGNVLWEVVGAGLNLTGRPGSVQGPQVEITVGNAPGSMLPRVESVEVVARRDVVMSQQAVLQMSLNVARSVPHSINSGVRHSPGAALAVLQPVRELGRRLDPFRGAPLPRVTGLENLPTLSEMVADALEGARIGTYTPPNPKLPGGRLSDWLIAGAIGTALGRVGVLLAQRLAQLWGAGNGRSLVLGPGQWAMPSNETVFLGSAQTVTITSTRTWTVIDVSCSTGEVTRADTTTQNREWTVENVVAIGTDPAFAEDFVSPCGSTALAIANWAGLVLYKQDATSSVIGTSDVGSGSDASEITSITVDVTYQVTGANGQVIPPPPVLINGGDRVPAPVEFDRSSAPAPGPLPVLPLPTSPNQPAPADAPAVSPGPQPAPGQAPAPAPFPSISPSRPPLPTPAPGVPALPGDGSAPAPIPVPTPTTPPATVIPWPGAPPIGGPGQAPAPTLTGIAQEVGRIERKIDVMMGPRPGGQPEEPRNWQDQLDDLMDLLDRIELGGSYELRGVCEIDANGEPVETVIEHPWPPGFGQFAGVFGRLDAIASMLQTHKELRQPICRHPKPQGEFVTVQFEEL